MNKTRTTETGEPDARVRITATIEPSLLEFLDHRHVSRSEAINADLARYYSLMGSALKEVKRKCEFTKEEEAILIEALTTNAAVLRASLEGRKVLIRINRLSAVEHMALADAARRYRHCTKIGSPWRSSATLWDEPNNSTVWSDR